MARQRQPLFWLVTVLSLIILRMLPRRKLQSADGNAAAYDLSIDQQAEQFVELKQKLTYFLITASVVVISFAINFYAQHVRIETAINKNTNLSLLVVAAIFSLLAAGLALLNLHLSHQSFARHLGLRYERRTWIDLSNRERDSWDRVNKAARFALTLSFMSLFLEMLFLLLFFLPAFLN
jgi:hypothetical protein